MASRIFAWLTTPRPSAYFCIWLEGGITKAERIKNEVDAHNATLQRAGVLIDSRGAVVLDFLDVAPVPATSPHQPAAIPSRR